MTKEKLDALVFIALIVGALIAYSWWLHTVARDAAERWLTQQRYTVRTLITPWLVFGRFTPRLFRNSDRAHCFRAEVEDRSLGGTGIVFIRVWLNFMGVETDEPDISWDRMPVNTGGPHDGPPELQWEMAQRALLQRIALGEHTFTPPRRPDEEDGTPFDMLVEHLLALRTRGFVTCSNPRLGRRPGMQYDLVEAAELTDAGRSYLQRFN